MRTALILSLLVIILAVLLLTGWNELQKGIDQAKLGAGEKAERLDCLNDTLSEGRAAPGCPDLRAGDGQ